MRAKGALAAAALLAACTERPPTPPPPAEVARVQITALDTAGLVGTVLWLKATAYDRFGALIPGVTLVWRSFDLARASVDSLGRVGLGPNPGDVSVSVTEPGSRVGDTVSLHAAAEGEVKWSFAVSQGQMQSFAGPALGPDGTVYVLSIPFPRLQNVGDLHALSPHGGELWRLRLDRTIENGLLVGPDGTIYVTGRTVRAVTAEGTVRWSTVFLDAFGAEFTVGALAPGGLLIVAPGPRPIALHSATGDTVWVGPVSRIGAWLVPPTIAGPTAWIKKTQDSLYAFSASTGAMGRRIADPEPGPNERSFGVGPVVVGGTLYLPTALRLAAFDTTGVLRWLTDDRGWGVSEPVVDPAGNVYVQTRADGLLALNPTTGAWRWRRLAARPRWLWYGGPALAQGGTIYCAALDGFYAYDTEGNLRWFFQTKEAGTDFVPFLGAPAIGPDGTIYTHTETRVYAFWGSHPPESRSPWPMWRHDARRSGVAW